MTINFRDRKSGELIYQIKGSMQEVIPRKDESVVINEKWYKVISIGYNYLSLGKIYGDKELEVLAPIEIIVIIAPDPE
jgi:hypothetical protein